jgi:hypothetical protein
MPLGFVGLIAGVPAVVRQGRLISVGRTPDLLLCRELRTGSGGLAGFVHV